MAFVRQIRAFSYRSATYPRLTIPTRTASGWDISLWSLRPEQIKRDGSNTKQESILRIRSCDSQETEQRQPSRIDRYTKR